MDVWELLFPVERRPQLDARSTEILTELIERTDWLTRYLGPRVPYGDLRDIKQDVLVRIWLAAREGKFTDVANVGAYVTRIARNLTVDYYRRRSREDLVGGIQDLDQLVMTSSSEDVADNVVAAFEARQELTEIFRYLERISPQLRRVFQLSVEGYTSPEIAHRLYITTSTADRYLYRARAALLRRASEALSGEQEPEKSEKRPEEQTQRNDDTHLQRVVRRLGGRQAEVLRMSAEGLKPRQIAHLLDIDANAVRASLHYARRNVMKETGWTAEEITRRLSNLPNTSDTAKAS